MDLLIAIIITLFFVFLNGFFVASEFAIVKLRSSQLETKIKEGHTSAILVSKMLKHLDYYLAATQLGITISSLALGWIGEPIVSKIIISIVGLFNTTIDPIALKTISLIIAFIIITILHIVLGELAPKSLAIQRTQQTTLAVAHPLYWFAQLCRPFIWILNGIANAILKLFGLHANTAEDHFSSDELRYLVNQVKVNAPAEEIESYEIISNAFGFSERTARQIMVPRTKLVAIDLNDYNWEILDRVIEEGYSRIPCYQDTIDKIIGFVHLKDVLKKMRGNHEVIDLRSIIRPVSFVPETKKIAQILKEFQKKHRHIAVVLNEYGGVEGIVTMEDILEEIVGEIQDESDNEIPFVERLENNLYSVLATASLSDINHELPHPIDKEKEYDTLAGLLIDKFGRIPNIYEKMESDNYEFTITNKTRTTIISVQVRDLTKSETPETPLSE